MDGRDLRMKRTAMITFRRGDEMPARDHDLNEIREAVAKLCASFPMEYWRATDRERRYPTEFVRALTEAGWLSCLIPEEYGGGRLKLPAAAAGLGGKSTPGRQTARPPPPQCTPR